MSLPVVTWSPRFIDISLTIPENGAGISIAALSLSRTRSESFSLTFSPTLTNNSMTSTSEASPRSGTVIFLIVKPMSPKQSPRYENY